MLTDESLQEWARCWLRDNTPEDPGFRQRFVDALAAELKARRAPAQAIADLAFYRLSDPRTTEENTRHDLEQILAKAEEMGAFRPR